MPIINSDQLTPREAILMEKEQEENRLNREHAVNMKRLEIELNKLDIKWGTWLKIPLTIIKLPIYALFGIAYIVSMITKKDMPEDFWRFLR